MCTRICLALTLLVSSPVAFAQHVELGAFGSYGNFDIPPFPATAVGVGGRIDLNLRSWLVLEGEGSYDFKHPRVQIIGTGVAQFNVNTLSLGVVHGNGGFKFQFKGGSYFVFVKGGVLDFQPQVRTTSLIGAVVGSPQTTVNSFTEEVFYPGAGIGFHAGPLGIRVDAGDEIYWDDGAKHNLRVTFGPTIRF